jgi:hypothetical protein
VDFIELDFNVEERGMLVGHKGEKE